MVDEDELELYLDAIDELDDRLQTTNKQDYSETVSEQLRDEHGFRVPGCYRTAPSTTYG